MFNFSQPLPFGLDLSDLSLKIVQLKRKGKGLQTASFFRKDLPAGLIEGGEIKREKELVEILKTAVAGVKGESLETGQVVCNLPEEKVFIRLIQLPKMEKEEIDEAIKWQVEANIPLPIDEVYLDWQMIRPIKNNLDHFDILVAAAPKSLVESYLNVLKKSGLTALALEPESAAVVRSLIKEDENTMGPTMIIDLGSTGTNFVIFSAGAIRFTSHISISGQTFGRAIMEKLDVDETRAEELKIKADLDKLIEIKADSNKVSEEYGRVCQILEPLLADFSNQIRDYINFYHEHISHIHGPDGVIARILLCGGDSLLINLPDFLSRKLNLEVELGNPWINIYSAPPEEVLGLSYKKSLAYTTALGLALRQFLKPET